MGQDLHTATGHLLRPAASPERGSTVVVDSVLAVAVVTWSFLLVLADPGPTLRWAVPIVLGLMVVHRVLVLVESAHRRTAQAAVPSSPREPAHPTPAQAA